MRQLKSCGWILISPQSRILLLQNSKRADWGLPKGHIDEGETEMQTALRELEEETGLQENNICIDKHFKKEIHYTYLKKSGETVHKQALYFRAYCTERDVQLSHEHSHWQWATASQITLSITHTGLRHLILEAIND